MRSTERPRRLCRDTRGSATTEGVIIAPVFILLFAIAIWAYVRYRAGVESADDVRTRLWSDAVVGCDDGPRDAPLLHETRLFESSARSRVPALAPYYDEVRADGVEAGDTRRVDRPIPLGGGTLELHYEASTSCNTVPIDFGADLPYATRLTFCRAVPYCDDDCNCGGPP